MQRTFRSVRSHLRRLASDESGTHLVEFAFVLPMMLLVFGVIIEGGRMMWSYQTVVAGVRDATRFLARVTPRDICDDDVSAISDFDDTLIGFIRNDSDGSSVLPSGVTVTGIVTELECFDGEFRSDVAPIATVRADVEVTFPFAALFILVGASHPTLETSVTDQSRVYGS